MFGPPQPAASTKAFSAVESSSTSDPSTAAQNLASASASAASNDTDLITLGILGTVAAAVVRRHLELPAWNGFSPGCCVAANQAGRPGRLSPISGSPARDHPRRPRGCQTLRIGNVICREAHWPTECDR